MKSNLKKLRKEAGLTLQQLADITGGTKAQLSLLENEKRTPLLKNAYAIAKALDVTVFQIWEDK